MGVAVAHGKKPAASKHGFSFSGKVLASVAALSMLARDYSGIPNKNASTDCHPSPFGPILLRLTFLFLLLCTRLILTHWLSTASVLLLGVMVALTLMTLMK
jgi:hypothetical protein